MKSEFSRLFKNGIGEGLYPFAEYSKEAIITKLQLLKNMEMPKYEMRYVRMLRQIFPGEVFEFIKERMPVLSRLTACLTAMSTP